MTDAEYLRKHIPDIIPFAVRELLIANVVVGNYSLWGATLIADALAKQYRQR